MKVDTPYGKIELSDAALTLTKSDGSVLQWDEGSIYEEKDAFLAKRAVLASIGVDTNVFSNRIILAWIKSRQMALAT